MATSFEYADIDIRIEPEIVYRDGHSEWEDTHYFRTRVTTENAGEEALKMAQDYVNSIAKPKLFNNFRLGFIPMLKPIDESLYATDKLKKIYHIYASIEMLRDDGEMLNKSFEEERVVAP
jgi:hypothetical protein